MAHEVKVRQPLASVDLDAVQRALGETPLKVRGRNYVPAPFITIDGRVNPSTSFYLSHHCRSSSHLGTATRIAGDLKNWVDFLVNERHLPPFIDDRDPVLMATEDDWAAFYRRSQYPESYAPVEGRDTGAGAMTSESWKRARSAAKRLYEHLNRHYQHPMPFDVVDVVHQATGRQGTSIVGYQPRRRSNGSRGIPIDPHFAQVLLQAALRIDANGQQRTYLGADRDQAVLALGLASGIRRNNLVNTTTYEVPRPVARDFTLSPGSPTSSPKATPVATPSSSPTTSRSSGTSSKVDAQTSSPPGPTGRRSLSTSRKPTRSASATPTPPTPRTEPSRAPGLPPTTPSAFASSTPTAPHRSSASTSTPPGRWPTTASPTSSNRPGTSQPHTSSRPSRGRTGSTISATPTPSTSCSRSTTAPSPRTSRRTDATTTPSTTSLPPSSSSSPPSVTPARSPRSSTSPLPTVSSVSPPSTSWGSSDGTRHPRLPQ